MPAGMLHYAEQKTDHFCNPTGQFWLNTGARERAADAPSKIYRGFLLMYWEYKAEVPTENYAYPSAEQAIGHFQNRAMPYTEHHL